MLFLGTKVIEKYPQTPSFLNVISTCPWYYSCSDPLYVGKCRKECFDRYNREINGRGEGE